MTDPAATPAAVVAICAIMPGCLGCAAAMGAGAAGGARAGTAAAGLRAGVLYPLDGALPPPLLLGILN